MHGEKRTLLFNPSGAEVVTVRGPIVPKRSIDSYGSIVYKVGDIYHKEDGPAVEHSSGRKDWYINGKRHREGGPAVEHSEGYKEWQIKGKLHREDGPAVVWSSGRKYWYINGTRLTEEEFNA